MEKYEILYRLEKAKHKSFDLLLAQFKCEISCEWCYLNTQLYDNDILDELSLYAIKTEDYEAISLIKKELEYRKGIGFIFNENYKRDILLRIKTLKNEKNKNWLRRFIKMRQKHLKTNKL